TRRTPYMHGLMPACGPVLATAGRTSPVRRPGGTDESGSTRRVSSHLYDVSQTSTGCETSCAVRWETHVSWTCIRPTRQTGHASERGWGVDAVTMVSTAGLGSAGDTGACPRSS